MWQFLTFVSYVLLVYIVTHLHLYSVKLLYWTSLDLTISAVSTKANYPFPMSVGSGGDPQEGVKC